MQFLAWLVGSAFAGVVDFLARFVTRKVALGVVLGGFLSAGWLACMLAIKAIFEGIAWVTPEWLVGPLQLVAFMLPSNLNACFSAAVSAVFVRWVWDRQREWGKAIAAL